jgi:hypothetical protein
MRRLSLAWVLSLLLVFAQQGAVLHGLSHLTHGSADHGGARLAQLQESDSASCPSCEAFAQVTNPAGANPIATTLCPARLLAAAASCHAFEGADALTPRSRGPPQV